MACPPGTHIGKEGRSRYRLRLATHQGSLSPNLGQGQFVCAFLYQRDRRSPSAPRDAASSPASAQQARGDADRSQAEWPDRSITLSGKSLPIWYLPERCCFACCKPVAQTRAQLADTFNAMDAGGQFWTQQSAVCCLVSQPSHGRHSHVDRPGRKAALLQMKAIAQNRCFVEGQSWFGNQTKWFPTRFSLLLSNP